MENVIAQMLEDEIKKTLDDVSKSKNGSDEAKAALMKLEKLHGQRVKELEAALKDKQLIDQSLAKIDELKLREEELKNRVAQSEAEIKVKEKELEVREAELTETRKGRIARTVLDIFGIAVPLGVSSYWMFKGMKFEEDGKVYSSRTGQWLSNHLRLFGKKG